MWTRKKKKNFPPEIKDHVAEKDILLITCIVYICDKQLLVEIFNYLKTQLTSNHELQTSCQKEILSNKIMYEIRKLMQIKDDGVVSFTQVAEAGKQEFCARKKSECMTFTSGLPCNKASSATSFKGKKKIPERKKSQHFKS